MQSDVPKMSPPDTPAGSSQAAFADTECAQALLDLAKSVSPLAYTPQDTSSPPDTPLSGDPVYNTWHGSVSESHQETGTHGKRTGKTNNSILKRQLEVGDVGGKVGPMWAKFGGPRTAPLPECCTAEARREEICKRIRLDHNYAWVGEDRNKYHSKMDGQMMATEKETFRGHHDGSWTKNPGKGGLNHPTEGKRVAANGKSNTGKRRSKSPKTSPRGSHSPRSTSKGAAKYEDSQAWSKQAQGYHAGTEESCPVPELGSPSGGDMYEPSDSKYKNLNLLLKCLTSEGEPEHTATRERCDSHNSATTLLSGASASLGGSPTSTSEEDAMDKGAVGTGEDQDHRCHACPKVFSKKRYLTKHQQRMHPQLEPPPPAQWTTHYNTTICPTCQCPITKRNIRQHAAVCSVSLGDSEGSRKGSSKKGSQDPADLADCQFCGMRMRRHILVKHLALEHCQDSGQGLDRDLEPDMDPEEGDEEEDIASNSDSSTLSGSEHDRDDVAMATSPRRPLRHIPGQEVSRGSEEMEGMGGKLNYKFQFSHSILHKNTVSCQLCGQRVSRMQLTEHLASEHNVEGGKGKGSGAKATVSSGQRSKKPPLQQQQQQQPSVAPQTPPTPAENHTPSPTALAKPSPGCNHSMLQRFLSDGDSHSTGSEECESCVSRLVANNNNSQNTQAGATATTKKKSVSVENLSPRREFSLSPRRELSLSPKQELCVSPRRDFSPTACYTILVKNNRDTSLGKVGGKGLPLEGGRGISPLELPYSGKLVNGESI